MAKIIGTVVLLATVTMLVIFLKTPRAEQVEHHGNMVNAEGHAAECILCHDGTIAKAVSNCVGVRCNTSTTRSHPVERTYPSKDSFVSYGNVVRSGIQLDAGQVSCISCHDLRNQGPGHPAVRDTSGSNLCFRCHIK